jgi:uncharacterized membrane protein
VDFKFGCAKFIYSLKFGQLNKVATRQNPEKAIGRMESFSDSIFGFAITLLVLELLQIPRSELAQDLFHSLSALWQHFFAFLVGFCTILICWINHHHIFSYIVRYDGKFIWINGALLLIVTFIPLPTALFSEYLLRENSTGLVLFGLTYFMVGCVAYAMWAYTYRNQFLNESVDKVYYQSILSMFRYGWLYTLMAFFVCFISSEVAMVMYLLLFAVFAFPHYFALKYQQYFFKTRLH